MPADGQNEVVLYCSCPNEITSARAALRLKRNGVKHVRPLEGGFPVWKELGFPIEHPAGQPAVAHPAAMQPNVVTPTVVTPTVATPTEVTLKK
jgi:3-mercaptopyruvate sulfurtransferase SseA